MACSITFITATWNAVSAGRGDALSHCIRSVASCAFPHEHLIIDGGSQDGTVELLQNLTSDCPNMRFISERDKGIYNALNKGIKMAQGEWVHVLGCDDWICSPTELSAVLADPKVANADMIVTPVEREDNLRTINLKSCLYSIPFCHQGLLMRTDTLSKLGGFDEDFKLASDYALMLKAFLMNPRIAVVDRKFCHYSIGGASSAWETLRAEGTRVAVKYIQLTQDEVDCFDRSRVFPLRVLIEFLLHRNRYVRMSAAFSLLRWMRFKFNVLNKQNK